MTPVQSAGQRLFCLRDRSDPTATPLVVSQAALLLASLLDGERTLETLETALLLRTGARLPRSEFVAFLDRLDQANLLDSDGFRTRVEQQRRAFADSPDRPAIHAGAAYPASLAELEPFLDRFYTAAGGPGAPPEPPNGRAARALIAPHIDLHRGGPTYACTYRALAECEPADLYLLLGTCHTSMATPLAATRKPYATPLGAAPVDLEFLDLLEVSYSGSLYADEYSHRGEHSLEFQALYLRYLHRVGQHGGSTIVPLLCGSLHEWVSPDASPLAAKPVDEALAALRKALDRCGRRVCLVAGADLAHVGQQFGDQEPVTSQTLDSVGEADRSMLELVCRGDADGFYRQVMEDRDRRRICGLSPIYYLLSLAGSTTGRLLKYSQWVDPAGQGAVTFAGVIFEE